MQVLFIENEDSFSWNVVDRLPVGRASIRIEPGREPLRISAALPEADVVVLGPGPLDPVRAGVVDVVRAAAIARKPLLGICLGHQAVGLAFGARLVRTAPRHGVRDRAVFRDSLFFPSFRGETEVMRYHSLALTGIESPLRVVASTPDGVVMAVEHEALPIAGLQFHPDSFGTPRGEEMLRSFFEKALP